MNKCAVAICLAFVALASLASSARAQAWNWQLPPARYQKLDVFQRGQYDKAAGLFAKNDFLAAASEFERFKAQYTDSPEISYMLFMQGLSQHSAKNRNAAIKIYNEVLDFFGDHISDAAPALYYLGQAQFENGETVSGMKSFQEMADDDDYRKHPLAAGAIRTLADNFWNNKDEANAVKYWKQVVTDFETTNAPETQIARSNLSWYYVVNHDYAGLEQALITYQSNCIPTQDTRKDDPGFRRSIYDFVWNDCWNSFVQNRWQRYGAGNNANDKRGEDMGAFFKWFEQTKPWWDKANDTWGYYDHTLRFLCYRWGEKESKERQITEVTEWLKTWTDKPQADQRLASIIDMLRESRTFDRARYCMGLMQDRLFASYKEYEVLVTEQKWEDAIKQLQSIEASGVAFWVGRAVGERAHLYKDVLGRYEDAIKLYQQMNNPPGNLWAIQECFMRWGKFDESINQLTEIENSFPDQSSRAAWQKTAYYDQAGDNKKAISQAKRLLKLYPKSPESSSAHQLLEKYGIATGGGVTDEP